MSISGNIPHAGISNINIPLNRRNLIITGKNGSGKTSFLKKLNEKLDLHFSKQIQQNQSDQNAVKHYLTQLQSYPEGSYEHSNAQQQLSFFQARIDKANDALTLNIDNELELIQLYDNNKAIYKSFEAMRTSSILSVTSSTSIEQEKSSAKQNKSLNLGQKLEQHLINIRISKAFSFERNDSTQLKKLNSWFEKFDNNLKLLFENDSTTLIFKEQSLKFKIKLNDREFDFQNLSSGYQAIFDIFADLLVRTEFFDISPEELRGIVLIDEIDAHLHISLQKKILPFFTNLFPSVQFIVSTHSPFVITSTDDDTVVYDISSGEFFEDDLSRYSYESVIKGLFHVETQSEQLASETKAIAEILNNEPNNYEKLREILRNISPFAKQLDVESKSFYFKALNHLLDNQELGDLDV
ncbi:TPA: AAA family ATPase [Acinetobacter baumannii]|uniref:AAA family ATPase n=2 Tax=Acinetobacter baumannii TaxID=470 RepID=UPI000298333A|nr:ATP-binding protein [Acinetobacter baumannii]EKP44833.1 AAA domain protein [Acinetobacter baumannii OIFC111]EXB42143.1 AAA ATPase domain protein [Acinetobacter baumannii 1461963]EXH44313.1 AAA ATPase domain protein [Acinetobacter baumannii 1293320]MCW1497505.1 ATP-binding protein [Acinetobacter baumannii]MDH2638701.1 ATP-binding protein [Acinetobacter baumannii]